MVLFTADEITQPLRCDDPRARHALDVLRRTPGDDFDVGLINGPRGKATITAITATHLELQFIWGPPPPPPDAITLLIGLPRPQTARDILRDATTMGVAAMHFVATDKTEPSYAQSALWRKGEWHRHLRAGAEQAFDTRVPKVTATHSLAEACASLPDHAIRVALDNYEASAPLAEKCNPTDDSPLVLAFGPERGWAEKDRALLRAQGFALAHLGPHVLRLETAVTAALAIAKSRRGRW